MSEKLSIWLQQIRAPFLILSIMLVSIGVGVAHYEGVWHPVHALLLVMGVVLAHISVNLFNEVSDFQTGIDSNTRQTPFSGGSKMMQSGKTSLKQVQIAAYGAMVIAGVIGFYFIYIQDWILIIPMILGGIAIRFYTSHLAKWLLGEFFSGFTLGSLVVIGTYYALTGQINTTIILVSVPPGILTTLLLFLNELPDLEADRAGGRYHWAIHLGRKKSAYVYAVFMCFVYVAVALIPLLSDATRFCWLAGLTLPVALKAINVALKHHSNIEQLIPAMGMNVMVVLMTDLLLAVGFFVA